MRLSKETQAEMSGSLLSLLDDSQCSRQDVSNVAKQTRLCARAKGVGAISPQGVPERHAEAQPATTARYVIGMHNSACNILDRLSIHAWSDHCS